MHMEKSKIYIYIYIIYIKNWPKMNTLNFQMEKKNVRNLTTSFSAHFKTHTRRLSIQLQISDHRLQLLLRL
jgi:hypothetical protein